MHRHDRHSKTFVTVVFATLIAIVPVAGAFNGLGETSTGSSMGSFGQTSQPTQGLQTTPQGVTEPSSALETPASSSQSEASVDSNPPLPTPDLSQQTLSGQAGSIKRQPPQPTPVPPPLIDPLQRSGASPSTPSQP